MADWPHVALTSAERQQIKGDYLATEGRTVSNGAVDQMATWSDQATSPLERSALLQRSGMSGDLPSKVTTAHITRFKAAGPSVTSDDALAVHVLCWRQRRSG